MSRITEEEFDKLDLKGKQDALIKLLEEAPKEKIPEIYDAIKKYCDEEGITIEE